MKKPKKLKDKTRAKAKVRQQLKKVVPSRVSMILAHDHRPLIQLTKEK